MEKIFLPSKIEISAGSHDNEGILTVEPLAHGYGTTIGNALRRVLLSSLPGAAVTAVKIKGAEHEFMAIDGVMEDILDITLNLKQLRMNIHTDEPVKLTLKKKGLGPVTAADFDKDSTVEIINPDLHICELTTKSAEFIMEVLVAKGLGFEAKETRERENKEVGLIEVDALFSPVRHVGYQVEPTRVGQITDYDKLVLTLETDGTITPAQAVKQSAELLNNHLNLLVSDLPQA